jgi:hypothetical protein
MLIDSKLPRFLWAEAMNHAAWIKNRSPTRALNNGTPYKARYGKKPDMLRVVPFGMRAWVKIVDAGKLEPRAMLSHFVGFDAMSTGYRIYVPDILRWSKSPKSQRLRGRGERTFSETLRRPASHSNSRRSPSPTPDYPQHAEHDESG